MVDDKLQPLGFFSKKLSSSQQNWSTYRRELLAIYRGIKHFEDQIEGRQLTIYTDHKPIIFAFKQKLEKAEPLQREQLIYISQYSTDIRHIKGKENVVADFLSRIETISQPIIDYNKLSEEQEKDEETQEIIEGKSKFSITLNKLPLLNSKRQLLCHIQNGQIRPLVPKAFRKSVFDSIHNLAHTGTRATKKLISEKFVWPSMNKDITIWSKQCLACQKSKIHRHNSAPFER